MMRETGQQGDGRRWVSFPVAGWDVVAQELAPDGAWSVTLLPCDCERKVRQLRGLGPVATERKAAQIAEAIAEALNHVYTENARAAAQEV